jgi:hypothetical protein
MLALQLNRSGINRISMLFKWFSIETTLFFRDIFRSLLYISRAIENLFFNVENRIHYLGKNYE